MKPKKTPGPSVIESAKASESRDSLILIIRDVDAMKVMQAWRLSKAKFADRPLRDGEYLPDALEEIWLSSHLDLTDLSEKAGLPLTSTVTIFNRLRQARLIYPDGTVHKAASAIISNEISVYIKSLLQVQGLGN